MAFDAFLKIEGIPGESTDDKHKDWIEILSYSHGLSQAASGSRSSGGSATAERCNHQDVSIVKTLDKASPKLALFCCNGSHIKEVIIELCRAGGDKQKYMEYKLSDVIISSVRPGGSAQGGETLPLEEVSFNYGKIEWTYTEMDKSSGKPKGNVKSNWDLKANKGS
jgi:type VI secretion system secreted protein Hcp